MYFCYRNCICTNTVIVKACYLILHFTTCIEIYKCFNTSGKEIYFNLLFFFNIYLNTCQIAVIKILKQKDSCSLKSYFYGRMIFSSPFYILDFKVKKIYRILYCINYCIDYFWAVKSNWKHKYLISWRNEWCWSNHLPLNLFTLFVYILHIFLFSS